MLSSPHLHPAPEDKFLVNLKFNSKKKRLKISSALQKETPSETQQTHKAIDEDRRLLLQAVAVRIMKMRKHLQYNILIDVRRCIGGVRAMSVA